MGDAQVIFTYLTLGFNRLYRLFTPVHRCVLCRGAASCNFTLRNLNKSMLQFFRKYSEVIIWNGALILLGVMNVNDTSLCLLKNMGITWCPGCGLGHAIHYALHFEFEKSFQEHILGIPATLILFYQSCKSIYTINKTTHYGPATNTKNVS